MTQKLHPSSIGEYDSGEYNSGEYNSKEYDSGEYNSGEYDRLEQMKARRSMLDISSETGNSNCTRVSSPGAWILGGWLYNGFRILTCL